MKKKILIFHFDLGNGGAERVLVNLVNSLNPMKYDITVKTLYNYGVNKNLLNSNIKREWVFNCSPKRGVNKLLTLLSPRFLHYIFIREKFDVEIAYLEGSVARIISGCNDSSTKTFAWIHVEIDKLNKYFSSFRNLKEASKCYHKFNCVVCVSENTRNSFVNKTGWNDLKIKVIHNVLNVNEIMEKSKENIPLKLNNQVYNMCSVGRLNMQKGYDRLIEVFRRLKVIGISNWHFYLFGQGEEEKKLKEMVREYNLEDNFTFLGYIQKPYSYLNKMDLFVCPSRFEGFSTAITEALVLKIPVITTECSGMKEILGHDYPGIVENSIEGIFCKIKMVLLNKQFFTELRKKIKLRSCSFSVESGIKEFENLINEKN